MAHQTQPMTTSELNKPGVAFEVEGHRFVSTGRRGSYGLLVRRYPSMERDELDEQPLQESLNAGDVRLLGTYQIGTEIPVSKDALTAVLGAVEEHVPEKGDETDSELAAVVESIQDALDE